MSPNLAAIKKMFGDTLAPNGLPVHENFVKWFADSKVVDDAGRPRVLYHGSPSKFTEFDLYSSMDGGFYFTETKKLAESFSKDEDGEIGYIFEVYLSLKNPKIIDLKGGQQPGQDQMQVLLNAAKSDGHDGVELLGVREFNGVGTQYVAFHPEQIKSAAGNSGDFDPASSSLTDVGDHESEGNNPARERVCT